MDLLIYDDKKDVVTQELIKNKEVKAIYIEDLYNNVIIQDQYQNEATLIQWKIDHDITINNRSVRVLINRIKGYAEYDKDLYTYVSHVVPYFHQYTGSNVIHGYPSSSLPLPYQWKIIANTGLLMKTPEWHYGIYATAPKAILDSTHVVSTMYGYYNWKPRSENIKASEDQYQLVFGQPLGKPVHVFYSYDHWTSNQTHVDPEKINTWVLKLSEIFGQKIAEFLVFVDGENVTFGMFNSYPGQAAKNLPNFVEVLNRGLNYV
jgi:hypothetical protein